MTDSPEWMKRAAEDIARAEASPKRKRPSGRTPEGKGKGASKYEFVRKEAHHHGSAGESWGGPKKGAGAAPFVPGETGYTVECRERRSKTIKDREERLMMLKDQLFDLAMDAEREETKLSATVHALNREEGTPVQRVLGAGTTAAEMLGIQVEFVRPLPRD